MSVEDEIWRPGYSGPPPVSEEVPSGGSDPSPQDSPPQESPGAARRRNRRGVSIAGALAVVSTLIVGVLVAKSSRSDIELLGTTGAVAPIGIVDDRSPFSSSTSADFTNGEPLGLTGGSFDESASRRLPMTLAPQWTTELAPLVADGGTNATAWVESVDPRFVVVGIGDLRTLAGPSAIHVLDAGTGDKIWAQQIESRIDQVEFLAAVDDALVVTIGSKVLAFDVRSGSSLWSSNLSTIDGGLQRIVRLEGTALLARSGPGPEHPTELIEPSTGAIVGELTGTVLGSDGRGRWSVLRGDKLLVVDLSDRHDAEPTDGTSAPSIESRLVGAVDSEPTRAVAVIGESLVTTVNGMLAVGPLEVDGDRVVGANGYTPVEIDLGTPAWLLTVHAVIPLGGAAFAAVGSGSVIGAEVIDGSIRFAWQRRGLVTMQFATERGVVLLMATEGGAAQTLVDASTGDTIATLTLLPGVFDSLDVVENGIVTRRISPDGVRIAGLDLDGVELWSLDGSASVSVGDGLVVRVMPQPDGSFVVSAFGESE